MWFSYYKITLNHLINTLNCIHQSTFPGILKKSNRYPIYKKGNKEVINNYSPISLLPICGKFFERLFLNSLFEYHEEHKLLLAHENQLLSIILIYLQLLMHTPTLEFVYIFLDMSKVSDKAWHERLIFTLKSMAISST